MQRFDRPPKKPFVELDNASKTVEAAVPEEVQKNIEKRAFLEHIVAMVSSFDFSTYSDQRLFTRLAQLEHLYTTENDTHQLDIYSFTFEELEPVWQAIDTAMQQAVHDVTRVATPEQIEKVATRMWKFSPDGRLLPTVEYPAVIGGVHGDETTLPEQIRLIINSVNGEIRTNHSRGYYNHEVNIPALELGQRGAPSDMNRADGVDEITARIKQEVLTSIAQLQKPFLVDMHNFPGSSDDAPFGYMVRDELSIPDGQVRFEIGEDLQHKLALARELGLQRLELSSRDAMAGTMVGDLRIYNPNSDGMIIEVSSGDEGFLSSKIAMKFMELAGVLNDGRPSTAIQLEYLYRSPLPEQNQHLEVFVYDTVAVPNSDGAYYQIKNDVAVRIRKFTVEGHALVLAQMTQKDMDLLERS